MRWMIGLACAAACGSSESQPDAFEPPGPAADIEYVPGTALGRGSWILINDWNAEPNAVAAIDAGALAGPALPVFTSRRIWSMGSAANGSTIAISSWDAQQEPHFGLTLGDAIQNTFVYTNATQRVRYFGPAGSTWENANDECHELSPDGAYIYLCRRYDFMADGTFKGWRIGRIKTSDRSFEFLRAEVAGGPFELNAQPIPGTARIVFELRARPPATGRTIATRDLVSGVETMLWQNAWRPSLAPDGDRVVYADTTVQSRLRQRSLSHPTDPAIDVSPTLDAGDVAWAPDGNTIVYTVYDAQRICDHLERVVWNGSAWAAPERVRDCAQTHEFITDISWVTIP